MPRLKLYMSDDDDDDANIVPGANLVVNALLLTDEPEPNLFLVLIVKLGSSCGVTCSSIPY